MIINNRGTPATGPTPGAKIMDIHIIPVNINPLITRGKAMAPNTEAIAIDSIGLWIVHLFNYWGVQSEDDVIIDIVQEVLAYDLLSVDFALGQTCNFLGFLQVLLLVVQHLLQPEEIFPGLLIQLLVDISVNCDEFGNDHMFQGIHTSVCHFDLLIKGQKGCLEGCCLDQQVEDYSEFLSAFLD